MTNSFIIPIIIILIVVLIGLLVFRYLRQADAVEMVSEDPDEALEALTEYRTEIINTFIEHICLWMKWDAEKIRSSGGVSPEDQGIVRLVNDNEELFLTFDWAKKIVFLQLVVYDDEEDATTTYEEKISFKNNQMQWTKVHEFVCGVFADRIKQVPVEELLKLIVQYATAENKDAAADENTKRILFDSIISLYEYIIDHDIRDKELISIFSGLMAYVARYEKNGFADFLQQFIQTDEDEETK